jgi:cytidyltransferase-like protein
MDTVVIYPGRFHPFHKGHKSVYDALIKRFGKNRVYIATSNKVDPPKSPFTFDEKRAMMALTGVDPSRVVQVKNPYQATEITDNYDPQNTIALFAVSDKDMAEDPRFSFKPRKDGQPSYYQPASKDMQGFDKHGYIITVPTLQFNVLGKPMRSATEFRANFARADNEKQKSMITDLFGQYDPKTHNTMAQKIVEQLIRADEILDKLIEMGADDCYILEACIRVDTLVENINMKQRKQTLYQAIMEGGHTLPVNEAELACPVAAGDLAVNTENRDRTIKQFNYGPLNVDIPGDYWEKIADYWDTTEQAAKASNCGNCVAFDISERMKDCLPGDTFDDDGELGYCWMHHFKCHSARSCHTWAKGGPIKTEKESAEWQGKAFGVKEEITDFNTEDPMNSVIAIRGIGTMSISSALEKVSEMAMDIAKLGAMKDAKNVQDNLPRYMDLLATYNESIQEAYRELAQQRKRGGTASRGIDKDISEVMDQDRLNKFLGKKDDDDEDYKKDLTPITISGGKKKPGYRPIIDLDDLDGFNEHCGDPMAHDHAPGRTLLMKLYKKEMQCKPGSPEHFEVMQMIDGCRKNIGLDEGMWDDAKKAVSGAAKAVTNKVASDYDRRNKLFNKGKV